jgi:hypothetical protein
MSAYTEKLKDPRWQKRRLKVMEYARWRCQVCGVSDKTLHCHHSYYSKGKEPWQYPEGSIICICDKCHDNIHGKSKVDVAKIEPPIPPAPAPMTEEDFLAEAIESQPSTKEGHLYATVIAKASVERRLISAWLRVGRCTGSFLDGGCRILEIVFPPHQSFAKDFIEGMHLEFLTEIATPLVQKFYAEPNGLVTLRMRICE